MYDYEKKSFFFEKSVLMQGDKLLYVFHNLSSPAHPPGCPLADQHPHKQCDILQLKQSWFMTS